MPASAGAATAVVTPGTTSYGTPAAFSASASSPPRPSTNGSPGLQPNDPASAPRGTNEQRVDGVLRERVAAGAFADIEAVRTTRNRENFIGHERVVEHQIGPAQPNDRAPRQERRIAWTGTDERNKS